ncbi:MAG: dipeptidase [Candidatus Eremiobacteraeota bacterium]|nr:dipeptidase [Candidatus Eremiobacteraeota bacterium]MCW5868213.1 dipeptidase [Candidatus Eremiobacteraeota bacterium]
MKASQLLHTAFVCDGHADTFRNIVKKGGDFLRGSGGWHCSLPRMRQAGLNLQIEAVYTSLEEVGPIGTAVALQVIEKIHQTVEASAGRLRLVQSRTQLAELITRGGQGVLISLEGVDPLLGNLELLDAFYRLGLRALGLTHNHNSPAAGACGANPVAGLSAHGRELLDRMSELGILLDTAHLGRQAFDEALEHYRGPMINSHSCCQKFVPGERNLEDAQIRALADSGGLVAVTFVPKFLVTEGTSSSRDVFRHLEHMVEVAGIDAVAIGSDFDGVEVLPGDLQDPRDLVHLVERMLEAGWSDSDIAKILGGNWVRVLGSVLPN